MEKEIRLDTPIIGVHKIANKEPYDRCMANRPVLLLEAFLENEENNGLKWQDSRRLLSHYNPNRVGDYYKEGQEVTVFVRYCHPLTDQHLFRGLRVQNYRYPSANCYYVFSEWEECGLVPVESTTAGMITAAQEHGKAVWTMGL